MAEPTLSQVFGSGATQNSTTITITKADLAGLTASASNTAESLVIALALKWKSYLNQTNFDANIDQSLVVSDGFSSLTTRGTENTPYRTDQIILNLSKIDTGSTIDPDDY
jgi:hypothetical protein